MRSSGSLVGIVGRIGALGGIGLGLLACQETGVRPTAVVTAADSADQILQGFSHFVTDKGVQQSHIEADTAYIYEGSQLTELRHMRVVFFGPNGTESSVLTAQRGKYRMQSESMEAHGDVVVTSPDGRRLTTQTLRYDKATNTIWTDQPFRFQRGAEYLEGNSFRSDPDFRNVVTDQPRGAAGSGVLLPGQTDPDSGAASP